MLSRIGLVLVLLAVLFLPLPATTPVAEAGTNGQQVTVWVSCPYAPALAEVKVTGYNQNGKWSEWTYKPNSRSVTTTGWWWVGKVTVEFRYAGTNRYTGSRFGWASITADVPKNFQKNYYVVDVNYRQECSDYPEWLKQLK